MEEDGDALEVVFGVDADRRFRHFVHVERKAVFQQAQLFELFDLFEGSRRECGEALEGTPAVGIQAEVLEVMDVPGAVSIEGNRGAGEIERAAILRRDDFDGIGIVDIFGGATNFKSGCVNAWVVERLQEGFNMAWGQEGFVPLDVDVDLGRDLLGNRMQTVGSAGQSRGCHAPGPAAILAELGDLVGVHGDYEPVNLWTGKGGFIDTLQKGLACDFAEHFSWKPLRL